MTNTDINTENKMNVENLMKGKRGVVMGVANDKSIAWGIVKQCSDAGAEIALTYQGDVLEGRVKTLGAIINSPLIVSCDVNNPESVKNAFAQIKEKWGEIDFIVHAIAFSNKDELKGRYVDTSLDNFTLTMNVSCYSFTLVAKYASALMKNGGSMITLTYYGAEKAIPNYNVMGVAKAALEASVRYLAMDLGVDNIRVNSISAGPIRTLAASGISDFRSMLNYVANNSPLRRNVTQEEVGKTALYLLSDLSTGVTGENIHVDSGFHSVGMQLTKETNEENN